MLFDPKRHKQWKAKAEPSLKGFTEWTATKPRDREYVWSNPLHCPCGQYMKTMTSDPLQWREWWRTDDAIEQANELARHGKHTYGALRRRCLKQLREDAFYAEMIEDLDGLRLWPDVTKPVA